MLSSWLADAHESARKCGRRRPNIMTPESDQDLPSDFNRREGRERCPRRQYIRVKAFLCEGGPKKSAVRIWPRWVRYALQVKAVS